MVQVGEANDSLKCQGDWILTSFHASRIILDEAQSIKNKATKSAKAVYELQALTRFAMSGTPMMNNVGELFSLIHFLRIKPYCVQEKFNTACIGFPFIFRCANDMSGLQTTTCWKQRNS